MSSPAPEVVMREQTRLVFKQALSAMALEHERSTLLARKRDIEHRRRAIERTAAEREALQKQKDEEERKKRFEDERARQEADAAEKAREAKRELEAQRAAVERQILIDTIKDQIASAGVDDPKSLRAVKELKATATDEKGSGALDKGDLIQVGKKLLAKQQMEIERKREEEVDKLDGFERSCAEEELRLARDGGLSLLKAHHAKLLQEAQAHLAACIPDLQAQHRQQWEKAKEVKRLLMPVKADADAYYQEVVKRRRSFGGGVLPDDFGNFTEARGFTGSAAGPPPPAAPVAAAPAAASGEAKAPAFRASTRAVAPPRDVTEEPPAAAAAVPSALPTPSAGAFRPSRKSALPPKDVNDVDESAIATSAPPLEQSPPASSAPAATAPKKTGAYVPPSQRKAAS